MSNPLAMAARVPAPRYGTTYQYTLGTSALHFNTPDGWAGNYVVFSATAAIQLFFYGATDAAENVVTIVANQASSTAGTGADDANQITLTAHASTGHRICEAGAESSFRIPNTGDHFVMVAESAGTEVFMRLAS